MKQSRNRTRLLLQVNLVIALLLPFVVVIPISLSCMIVQRDDFIPCVVHHCPCNAVLSVHNISV